MLQWSPSPPAPGLSFSSRPLGCHSRSLHNILIPSLCSALESFHGLRQHSVGDETRTAWHSIQNPPLSDCTSLSGPPTPSPCVPRFQPQRTWLMLPLPVPTPLLLQPSLPGMSLLYPSPWGPLLYTSLQARNSELSQGTDYLSVIF